MKLKRNNEILNAMFIMISLVYSSIVVGDTVTVLGTPLLFFILWLISKLFSIRIVKVPYLKLAFDLKGFVMPCAFSILIITPLFLNLRISLFIPFAVLISLATALSSLNTVITRNYLAINVLSYTISFFLLSYVIYGNEYFYPYMLPLATVLGVVFGSDILHYMYMCRCLSNTILIIGGASEHDAIYLSTIIIQVLCVLHKVFIMLISRVDIGLTL